MLLPNPVRKLPADLAAVLILVAVTCATVLVPILNETPLRVLFGLVFVLFLPGYAFIAALFPEAGAPPTADESSHRTTSEESSTEDREGTGSTIQNRGIDGIERVALSFGLSIAIVPLIGLILNFTPWGIRLVPILVSVSAFTLVASLVAAQRRWSIPEDEQFHVPYQRWIESGREELLNPESQLDGVLNVLLVLSIVLAVASVGYAVMVPPSGEQFTEFYLLTEDDDGELVAANYPTAFQYGESQPVVVGIENHENEEITYTVVVQLQTVVLEGNETTVEEREEIGRFTSPSMADNESWHTTHDIEPTRTGTDLRVQYLLYRGEPPESPTVENSYRDVHLWIDVSDEE